MPRASIHRALILFLLVCSVATVVRGQQCTPPPITANAKNYNILSPEQEMVLGELVFQSFSGQWRFLTDEELNAYLNRIGERLIRHLPPTGLKFRFYIVDLSDVNAYNTPGGYVYVSRKLIAFSNSEAELAGVIAHELGHAVVRHSANNVSELLKKILNVTQLGDRKDVIDKFNLMVERQRTKDISVKDNHENEKQIEADRIGIHALVAAGYDPNAFASLFTRFAETTGKTGNWFTNIFGKPNPAEKRTREIIKAAEQLPPACRENRSAVASEEFLKWQAEVVSSRNLNAKESLPALLWKKELTPRLRSDISHFAVSPDKKYFLAQDDFSVTVVDRQTLKVKFQIPAGQAREASFTPDSKFVVFSTDKLRFEKWSIEDEKPAAIRELIIRRDCWEHALSPDGNFLACVTIDTRLNILDTQTGKRVFEKKDFYQLNFFEVFSWISAMVRGAGAGDRGFFHLEFSPDSRTLVASRSSYFRFTFRSNFQLAIERSADTVLALDLPTMKPIPVGGDIKNRTRAPFVFLDQNRILTMSDESVEDGGIISFPEGKRLAKFPLNGQQLKVTSHPDYIIVKPLSNARMGVVNIKEGKLAAGMDKADAAIVDNLMIYENIAGSVMVAEAQYDSAQTNFKLENVRTVELPVGPLDDLAAADVSDNFQWLGISSKTRGAIWDLRTGERKMYLRGFRGALLANSGQGIGQFPKHSIEKPSLALFNPNANSTSVLSDLPEHGAQQYRQFLLMRQSLKQKAGETSSDEKESPQLNRDVRIELRNLIENKVVWSREFPGQAPRLSFDEFSGRLISYWTLASEAGKARLKEDPTLAARAKELGNKDDDYLVEVFDSFAGKVAGTLLIETGKGSFYIQSGYSEGDWLVLHDSENRILAYSLKTGELRHRFFGAHAAINPSRDQILVENYPGDLVVYSLCTGEPLERLALSSGAAFVRFSLDGKRLFVLSSDQTAYAFDALKLGVNVPRAEPAGH